MEDNQTKKNRNLKILIFSTLSLFLALLLFLTIFVIKTVVCKITYNDISPNYHSFHKAYVVDHEGNGIDSVAVFLKDNSNFNLIYRTFTDSSGMFELFNDFHSYTLLNTPTSFELHMYIKGVRDTIIYKFKKHRLTHFKKVSGPDSIIVDWRCVIE